MIFSIVIFFSALGYLVVVGDYLTPSPAFMLAFLYERDEHSDDVRFMTILASAILILACVYRIFSNGLIPGLSDNWWPMALTWWLLILGVVKGHSTIK